jgi:hypothetical protein
MPVELDDLVAPPPAPDFRERLWERAAERDRVVARRWRGVAFVSLALAAAAVSAASVFAFGAGESVGVARTFDETRSCPVAVQGGIPVAMLSAHSTLTERNNGQMFTMVGMAGLMDHNGHGLGAVSGAPRGYGFPDGMCTKTKPIALARAGLPLYGVYKPGERGLGSFDNGAACWVGARITVRVHAVVDAKDRATSGTIALRSGKKLRPIAYVEWTPKRVAVYFGDDCHY